MENQKEINDRSVVKIILESAVMIIKKMGSKNGSLSIDESDPSKVSAPLNFKDLFDSTKVATLVASFKIPDNKGNLIYFYFNENARTVVKVRKLDEKEFDLYGHIIHRKFDHESTASILKYFYNVVTFVSCHTARENLLYDLAVLQKKYLETKDKTELSKEIKESNKSSLERKEVELEEFNRKFSVYLTGEHLFEKF